MSNELAVLIKRVENHEKRINALEGRKPTKAKLKEWYRSGSTIEKIIFLIEEKFFNTPQSISKIISELETKDYHMKAPDLTLPLRKIVRRGLLKKTKTTFDGSQSKNWLYIKA